MRFGTVAGRLVLVGEGSVLDVSLASAGTFPADPKEALGQGAALRSWADRADWSAADPLDESLLGPPVPAPRQVFAVEMQQIEREIHQLGRHIPVALQRGE